MNQGGQHRSSGGIVRASNSPYGGVDRVLLNNASSPDKVFGSSMPAGQHPAPGISSTPIYGNDNYVNPNLQGYSQTGQNVINVDQLNNGVSPVDTSAVLQMRRDQLVGGTTATTNSTLYPNQPVMPFTQSNLPPAPTGNPNQMYMQPPVIPQISEMQTGSMGQPGATPVANQPNNQLHSQPNTPIYHDLSTADGSLDYLNSIAPATQVKKPLIPTKLFVAIGGGLIALVLIVAVLGAIGNGGQNFGSYSHALGKAIANLQSIIDYGESNSQYVSSDLSGVIAETHLVMLSHQTQLSGLMTLAVDEDGEATEAEADETTTEDLDKALSQGHLGDVYQDALQERLTAVSEATAAAYSATNNEQIKTALNNTYIDVTNLLTRVGDAVPTSGGEAVD